MELELPAKGKGYKIREQILLSVNLVSYTTNKLCIIVSKLLRPLTGSHHINN